MDHKCIHGHQLTQDNTRMEDGLAVCLTCERLLLAGKFPAQSRQEANQRYYAAKRGGVTGARYSGMLEAQDGRCCVCGAEPIPNHPLQVCTSNFGVLALLCRSCEGLLGTVKARQDVYRKLLDFLDRDDVKHVAAEVIPAPVSEYHITEVDVDIDDGDMYSPSDGVQNRRRK